MRNCEAWLDKRLKLDKRLNKIRRDVMKAVLRHKEVTLEHKVLKQKMVEKRKW